MEVDTNKWKNLHTWVDWWTRSNVLRKLCKAFSDIAEDDWDELPGSNNPVESINRQSAPGGVKFIYIIKTIN